MRMRKSRCALGRCLLLVQFSASGAFSYSVLTHEAIIDSVWDTSIKRLLLKRFPDATPERLVVSQAVDSAQIPGKDGYMGILPGHAALLSELGHGTLSFTDGGKTESLTVSGGYVEVRDDHVRVLADKAEITLSSLFSGVEKKAQELAKKSP